MARVGEAERHVIEKTKTALGQGINGLERWLDGRDPTFRVCVARMPGHCAVAKFLDDETGTYLHVVTKTHAEMRGQAVELPPWAKLVVRAVDKRDYGYRYMEPELREIIAWVRQEQQLEEVAL